MSAGSFAGSVYSPQSGAAPIARRSAPMAPVDTSQSQYNPATAQRLGREAQADYTSRAAASLYGGLAPDQKKTFMPQAPAPTTVENIAGSTTYTPQAGAASLTVNGPGGRMVDNSPNPEGAGHAEFTRQFTAALAAGKGDEFAGKYMPQGARGIQAQYDQANQVTRPMPMDAESLAMRDPAWQVRNAAVLNAGKAAVADKNNATRETVATTNAAGRGAVAQTAADARTTAATATATAGVAGKLGAANIAATERGREADAKLAQNQSLVDAKTGLVTEQAKALAAKGQVTPEDKYKAHKDILGNARMTDSEKVAALHQIDALGGGNSPAAGQPPAANVGALQSDSRWVKQPDGTYTHPDRPGKRFQDTGTSLKEIAS